jgi:hypothetical protein
VVVEAEADLRVDERSRGGTNLALVVERDEPHDRDTLDVPVLVPVTTPHEDRAYVYFLRTRLGVRDVLLGTPVRSREPGGTQDERSFAHVDDGRREADAPAPADLLREDVVLRLRGEVGQDG